MPECRRGDNADRGLSDEAFSIHRGVLPSYLVAPLQVRPHGEVALQTQADRFPISA
jgi:hypothetical protein